MTDFAGNSVRGQTSIAGAVEEDVAAQEVMDAVRLGESKVAIALDKLRGVVAFHDRRRPEWFESIGHLVITQGGIAVIDSRRYLNTQVHVGPSMLLVGGRKEIRLVRAVEHKAAAVQQVVGSDVLVRPMLCLVHADFPFLARSRCLNTCVHPIRGVRQEIIRMCKRRKPLPVDQLASLLEREFPARIEPAI